MQALQGFRQLNTLAWRHLEESFEEMYPTLQEKRDVLDEEENEFGLDEDFIYEATNNFDDGNYNFYIWLGQNNIDTENMRAQFILNVLSEVDEYFSNEFDNRIANYTQEHIINCWMYTFANSNKDELKEMFNELIYVDDNTDDENENEFEDLQ